MKHLYYFMPEGIGINSWNSVGLISREMAIVDALIARGWDVTVISYDREKPVPVKTKAVILPKWPFGFLRGPLWPVYNWLMPIFRYPFKTRKHAVIMTNTAADGWPAFIAKKIWRVPFVARAGYVFGEQAPKYQEFKELTPYEKKSLKHEKIIYADANFGILPTQALKEWVVKNYNVSEKALHIIPNYVDTKVFLPLPNIARQRSVLMIARLHDHKRIPLVIESLAGTGVVLNIVGQEEVNTGLEPGAIKNKLIACANDFKVQLNLLGRVENKNLPTLMAEAGCFIISGVTEGHPRALVEAMSAAMPCIGIHGQGIDNILTDSKNALLVDAESAQLKQAILTLLDKPDLAAQLGKSARDFALEHYSLDNIAEKYDQLLTSLIN